MLKVARTTEKKGSSMTNELIKIDYTNSDRPTVLGRDLHAMLEVEARYNDWFPRMCEYGFEEGKDFHSFLSKNPEGGRPKQEHQLTIAMAKELCMLQRTEKGKQCRQYLIAIEEAWNTPEQLMARALRVADETIKSLTAELESAAPKVQYFDTLVDRNLLTNFRDTAKELHVAPKAFINFLLEKGYIYRDNKSRLRPYQAHAEKGLFEVKEFASEFNNKAGIQTLVTPKGRETFRLLVGNGLLG